MKIPETKFTIFFFLLFFLAHVNVSGQGDSAPLKKISEKNFIIGPVTIIGNKTTRERIIFRELTFKQGDLIDTNDVAALLKKSEENLHNTSLFNSVKITWVLDGNSVNTFIIVTERWYVFPLPIFEIAERNFNVWWRNKDFSRIIYGGVLTWNNFRGRNEELAITARLGYTQRLSFFYSIPYINKNQKSGLTFGVSYSRNHQSGVNTIDNETEYYKTENLYASKDYGGYIAYTNRPDLYHTHLIETGFHHAEVLDTVIRLNNDFFSPGESQLKYSVLRYFYKSEHRDLIIYPLKGYYLDFEIVKYGFKFLNDDIDLAYFTTHGKKFWQLADNIYFGSGVSFKYTTGTKVPYYLNRGLGYGKDYLRGYEYYVMDGQNYALIKSTLKLRLLGKKDIHLGFIPLTKFSTIPYSFYLNLYGDAGYVNDKLNKIANPLDNSLQIGYGAGIDFVTYYDVVLRFEYSLNKLGEGGFFLHFTSPI